MPARDFILSPDNVSRERQGNVCVKCTWNHYPLIGGISTKNPENSFKRSNLHVQLVNPVSLHPFPFGVIPPFLTVAKKKKNNSIILSPPAWPHAHGLTPWVAVHPLQTQSIHFVNWTTLSPLLKPPCWISCVPLQAPIRSGASLLIFQLVRHYSYSL